MNWELILKAFLALTAGIAVGAFVHQAWTKHSWWRSLARSRRRLSHVDERTKRVLP